MTKDRSDTSVIQLLLTGWYRLGLKYHFAFSEKGCAALAAYILALFIWANIVSVYLLLDLHFFPANLVGIFLTLACIYMMAFQFHLLFARNGRYAELNKRISRGNMKAMGLTAGQFTFAYSLASLLLLAAAVYVFSRRYW